jgi:hypothetical protein
MSPLRLPSLLIALALAASALAPSPLLSQTPKAKTTTAPAPLPEVIRDFSRLPEPVRAMRERILATAKTGDPAKVAELMKSLDPVPVYSFGGDGDPLAYWKSSYPDSEGVEALAILVEVLEAPFVHADKGTPQEMFVWPYFAQMPLNALTPEQKVELFKIVTGSDWKEMQEFGAYIFYRVGIAPNGSWQFFVAGD